MIENVLGTSLREVRLHLLDQHYTAKIRDNFLSNINIHEEDRQTAKPNKLQFLNYKQNCVICEKAKCLIVREEARTYVS